MCRYQLFFLRWSTSRWKTPNQVLFFNTASTGCQAKILPWKCPPAPEMKELWGPEMFPGSVLLTSTVTALYFCQGTGTVEWFLAYLCSWKMIGLCTQHVSSLLSWLTSFLPTEKPKVVCARSKNLPRDLVAENSSLHQDGRNSCPRGQAVGSVPGSVLIRNSRFASVGRRNQNLFISCSIIDLKIQTCKVTYIKPAIPYAQHIPEHQTHESLQLYS